jgi:hypothetical protein
MELMELFCYCDIITLHCPLTPETRHLIDADHHDPVGARQHRRDLLHVLDGYLPSALLEVQEISRERRFELGLAEREEC